MFFRKRFSTKFTVITFDSFMNAFHVCIKVSFLGVPIYNEINVMSVAKKLYAVKLYTHEKLKDHKCDECGKEFGSSTNLT